MDFSFNETQKEVQGLARQMLTDLATVERLNAIDKQEDRFDADLWKQLAEAGLLGVAIDEKLGGMGFGFTELALFVEEVGRTVAPVPVVPVLVSTALPIQKFGSATLKKAWLPKIASGESLVTAALMETGNEDPATPKATAKAKGKNLLVSGTKVCVPFAKQSDAILVSAKTSKGVVVVLVDPKAKGVKLTRQVSTTREPWYEVVMKDVLVPEAAIVVKADKGAAAMKWVSERTMAALCAMQIGVSDKSMRMTASYACERQQFGVAIGTFQAVQHRAANCYMDVECLKLTTYQAVSLLDSGRDATNEVAIAKIWAGDTGHRVSYAAQHLHGGFGIDRDYSLWRYSLWARQIEMTLGTSARLLATLGERIAAGKAFAE
ncbi:MAG: acyl-CoA dehydrogenase [Gammaproteobacteria bacterium]|nr:MAG: acyl-CoA dehydrogenase [Gammaproteobacteria bacterium]